MYHSRICRHVGELNELSGWRAAHGLPRMNFLHEDTSSTGAALPLMKIQVVPWQTPNHVTKRLICVIRNTRTYDSFCTFKNIIKRLNLFVITNTPISTLIRTLWSILLNFAFSHHNNSHHPCQSFPPSTNYSSVTSWCTNLIINSFMKHEIFLRRCLWTRINDHLTIPLTTERKTNSMTWPLELYVAIRSQVGRLK